MRHNIQHRYEKERIIAEKPVRNTFVKLRVLEENQLRLLLKSTA